MRTVLAILIIGGALPLAAAEVDFGVQAAASLPTSNLSDNAYVGVQGGGHMRWDFSHGHGIMFRADLAVYPQNGGTSVNGFAVAADYTYHLEGHHTGLYVLGGLSQASYHTSFSSYSRSDSGLGFDVGAGYDIDRHVGLQARYTSYSFTGLTYSAMNVGVTYTF